MSVQVGGLRGCSQESGIVPAALELLHRALQSEPTEMMVSVVKLDQVDHIVPD